MGLHSFRLILSIRKDSDRCCHLTREVHVQKVLTKVPWLKDLKSSVKRNLTDFLVKGLMRA